MKQVTVNDIMTITMDKEIELINQRYPIASFTSLGGFKYEITFDPTAHFTNGINVEFEFKYDGQVMPSITQVTLCDLSSANTTPAVTTPAVTTPAVTTPASINSMGAAGEFKYEFTFNPAIDLSTGFPTEVGFYLNANVFS